MGSNLIVRRSILGLVAISVFAGAVQATEYVVPATGDVGKWFAELPKDATSVVFSSAEKYHSSGDIVLPLKQLLVIDGKGCRLTLGANSNGFTYPINNMKEAMERTSCRYVIKDFAAITGGKKAIDLKATLGSIVENCDRSALLPLGETEQHPGNQSRRQGHCASPRRLGRCFGYQQPKQQQRAGTVPGVLREDHHGGLHHSQQRRCAHDGLCVRGLAL